VHPSPSREHPGLCWPLGSNDIADDDQFSTFVADLQIEQIKISFDGGATTMNFAEAALLIQGSACIYSKKVDYLHSLVFQVLGLLGSNKK